jgi:membrane glycosyltransferase
MLQPATRRLCGGALRIALGAVLETVLAALMAPVTMYVQSRGVAEVLAGKDSGWETQRRDDGSVPLSSLVRRYGGLGVFGALVGTLAYFVSPALAAWMSPVVLGMVLAIPVNVLTASPAIGQRLRQWGLLRIPEEVDPPPVLARAIELRTQRAPGIPSAGASSTMAVTGGL